MLKNSFKNDQIKDIPEIPDEITNAAKNGELILFLGAGVSRIIGSPSWKELATRYLKDLVVSQLVDLSKK